MLFQTVMFDERQFFLWNIEEMSNLAYKGADSCEELPQYEDKLQVNCYQKIPENYV